MPRRRHFLAGLAGLAAARLVRASEAEPARPFQMAYFETYSPLSYRDGERMRGILVDVIDEVLRTRLGLIVEHRGYPWPRAQILVERGESDAICTIATPARLDYALAVEEPVLTAPTRIFVRHDNPKLALLEKVRTLEELKSLPVTILSYSGNGWAKENLAGHNVIWGQAFDSTLKMLAANRGDIMVENAVTMQHTLRQTPDGTAIRMLPQTLAEAHFQLLLSKRSRHVKHLAEIDKALRQFKRQPGYKALLANYHVSL